MSTNKEYGNHLEDKHEDFLTEVKAAREGKEWYNLVVPRWLKDQRERGDGEDDLSDSSDSDGEDIDHQAYAFRYWTTFPRVGLKSLLAT